MCNNLITSLLKTIHEVNAVSSPCFRHHYSYYFQQLQFVYGSLSTTYP
ncbi:hypothetical protein GBAR_LOCUS29677 [Geodia barretti]|uniref:Uncharacterized protein n=1 Tax=Geodia barretti TaxID=519541 RepID=A0AA35TUD3_GEOBA|nr:hypothetical protein GBAR_LOCUS29677 [Geodia barretti]